MKVSINGSTPIWMVHKGKFIKKNIRMDDGGVPLVQETTICLNRNIIHKWGIFLPAMFDDTGGYLIGLVKTYSSIRLIMTTKR